MTFNTSDLLAILPEIAVLILAMLVILTELLITRRVLVLQIVTLVGLAAILLVTCFSGLGSHGGAFNGMIASDGFSVFLKALLIGVTMMVIFTSREYLRDSNVRFGEYTGMILIATCGMMVLVSATDMLTIFLGIETMSIALYVLAGIRTERARSSEAAFKYFLLGAFSTGFLLYGMALIYGATGGKTNLTEIGQVLAELKDMPVYLYAGVGLISVGLLFKVAAVPFHFWSPDVYQGAPTPVTMFMTVGPKAAAFAVFIRLFGSALSGLSTDVWGPVLWVVAVATMTLGNIIALSQTNIKRMLAYSSIAHAGYLLLAVLASADAEVHDTASAGLLFYLTAYAFMNIGAFTVAILVSRSRKDGDYSIDDYQGIASANPWIAGAMAIFMISLSGIPPTLGFFGKLYVFSAAVQAGYVTLVAIAVLNSVISVYYYLRIVVYMYMRPAAEPKTILVKEYSWAIVAGICAVIILLAGILPNKTMKRAIDGAETMVNPTQTVSKM